MFFIYYKRLGFLQMICSGRSTEVLGIRSTDFVLISLGLFIMHWFVTYFGGRALLGSFGGSFV